jgi:ADP-heptose:LPS heptosyltransferase
MNRFSSYIYFFSHTGALRDGLLALKAVHVLKKQFPDLWVVWFGHKEIGAVLAGCQEFH